MNLLQTGWTPSFSGPAGYEPWTLIFLFLPHAEQRRMWYVEEDELNQRKEKVKQTSCLSFTQTQDTTEAMAEPSTAGIFPHGKVRN